MRTSRTYKEYLLSKKHLELTVIREILVQPEYIQYAINCDCIESFNFLLKEYKVSYKEQLFESNEKAKMMMKIINTNGNIEILREVYKYYEKLYTDTLIQQVDQMINLLAQYKKGGKQIKDFSDQNWIIINIMLNRTQCLDFNMKLLEQFKSLNWIKNEFRYLNYMFAFAIKNQYFFQIQNLIKYVNLRNRDYNQMIPLEIACKFYNGQDTQIIETLLSQEKQNQTKIEIMPQSLSCFLIKMIKKQMPIQVIKQALNNYTPEAISSYRNRENKSLLFFAIRSCNLELVRIIMTFFSSKSFYERATDGTYITLEAQKQKNLELKKTINDYIQYKQFQEFMDVERQIDPTIPEKLLLLKKQLFPAASSLIEKYKYEIKQLPKAKRQKSLQTTKLDDFYNFSEHLQYRRMTEAERRKMMLMKRQMTMKQQQTEDFTKITLQNQQLQQKMNIFKSSVGTSTFYKMISASEIFKNGGSFVGNLAAKFNFEKRHLIFHQEQYKQLMTQLNCVYLNQENFFEKFKTLNQINQIIFNSFKSIYSLSESNKLSARQDFHGSKWLDNSEFNYIDKDFTAHTKQVINQISSPSKSPTLQMHQQKKLSLISEPSQSIAPAQNKIMASISYYINRMLAKTNSSTLDQVDELQEFISPIIAQLTQQKFKYNQFNSGFALDLNKMTIAQRKEYDTHQKQKKKVYQQIQKDYSKKLKIQVQAKRNVNQEQDEVDKMLGKSPGLRPLSKKIQKRSTSKGSIENPSNLSLEQIEHSESMNQNYINISIPQNIQEDSGFSDEISKQQKTIISVNPLVNSSNPSPSKASRLGVYQKQISQSGQNTGALNSSREQSESSKELLIRKNSQTPKNQNYFNQSPNVPSSNKHNKSLSTNNKQLVAVSKNNILKANIQRQQSNRLNQSPTPSIKAQNAEKSALLKPAQLSKPGLISQIKRRSTVTPQALSKVRLNLKTLNKGQSGSSENLSSGRDSKGDISTERSRNQKVFKGLNLSQNQQDSVRNKQKQLRKASNTSLEEDKDLDSERNDIVLQLGLNTQGSDDENQNFLELNKIDEVSQMLESGSPQVSPKGKNKQKRKKTPASRNEDKQQDRSFNSDAKDDNQNRPASTLLKLIKADSLTTDRDYQDEDEESLIRESTPNDQDDEIKHLNDSKEEIDLIHFKSSLQEQTQLNQENMDALLQQNDDINEGKINQNNQSQNLNKNDQKISDSQLTGNFKKQNLRQSMQSGQTNSLQMDSKPTMMKSYIKTKQILGSELNQFNQKSLLPPQHPLKKNKNNESVNTNKMLDPLLNNASSHNMFIPYKLLHKTDSYTFNKYRYKDEEEAKKIQKVVQNVNLIRYLKGSPLRLYPELFQQTKNRNSSNILSSYTLSPQHSTQVVVTSQNFNSRQRKQQKTQGVDTDYFQDQKQNLISQKENLNHRKRSIIQKNLQTLKSGVQQVQQNQFIPVIIEQAPSSSGILTPKQTIFGNFPMPHQVQQTSSISSLPQNSYFAKNTQKLIQPHQAFGNQAVEFNYDYNINLPRAQTSPTKQYQSHQRFNPIPRPVQSPPSSSKKKMSLKLKNRIALGTGTGGSNQKSKVLKRNTNKSPKTNKNSDLGEGFGSSNNIKKYLWKAEQRLSSDSLALEEYKLFQDQQRQQLQQQTQQSISKNDLNQIDKDENDGDFDLLKREIEHKSRALKQQLDRQRSEYTNKDARGDQSTKNVRMNGAGEEFQSSSQQLHFSQNNIKRIHSDVSGKDLLSAGQRGRNNQRQLSQGIFSSKEGLMDSLELQTPMAANYFSIVKNQAVNNPAQGFTQSILLQKQSTFKRESSQQSQQQNLQVIQHYPTSFLLDKNQKRSERYQQQTSNITSSNQLLPSFKEQKDNLTGQNSPQHSNNNTIVQEVLDDQYEQLSYTHQKILGTLHAHPNMKTILHKEKSYYKRLKNSEISVPEALHREMKKERSYIDLNSNPY